ncbi:hypothetical protein U9M48_004996 [Paspalum notatum var. saurae]|uniref:Uncharacterized protein n=1 Tax=Paspalum notatum var. saurae TaxID=547442 RepID=A0AAQ3PPV1_PASNO
MGSGAAGGAAGDRSLGQVLYSATPSALSIAFLLLDASGCGVFPPPLQHSRHRDQSVHAGVGPESSIQAN